MWCFREFTETRNEWFIPQLHGTLCTFQSPLTRFHFVLTIHLEIYTFIVVSPFYRL